MATPGGMFNSAPRAMSGMGMGMGSMVGSVSAGGVFSAVVPGPCQDTDHVALLATGAGMMGANPLYNPMGVMHPQQMAMPTTPGNVTPPTPTAAAPAASEAEMLQQLMSEINRLKGELGEH